MKRPHLCEESGSGAKVSAFVALVLASFSIAFSSGCANQPKAPEFLLTEHEWSYGHRTGKHYETDHFEIFTTINDEGLREVLPIFLESAYRQYVSLVPLESPPDRKLHTYLFSTREEWDRYIRSHFPARYPVYSRIAAGGFAEGNVCIVYYLRRIYTLSVIAHEGFHQYLGAHDVTRIPAWLNEGLACYCETFQFRDDVPVFTPMENAFRREPLREVLVSDSLIPLRDLLSTNAGAVIVQNQSARTRAYYAQVWALVCMLRDGANGKYRRGFDAMCRDLANGQLPVMARAAQIAAPDPSGTSFGESVFRAYITDDLEGFERAYHSYLRELSF